MDQGPPIIMGIDPGTLSTGYGLITHQPQPAAVAHGTIIITGQKPIHERLHLIHTQLLQVIETHNPDVIAVEEPFMGKNVKSAIAVGQAQAIAFLCAASKGIPLYKYSPSTVKTQVTADGHAGKKQVRDAVAAILNIDDLPLKDEADALAVAICHLDSDRERQFTAATGQDQSEFTPRRTRSRR